MTPQDKIAQALWRLRPPNDSFKPTTWVRVYTWRGDRCVLIITELELPGRIERRIDGHITDGHHTDHVIQHSEYRMDVAERILAKLQPLASTQPNPEGSLRSPGLSAC
jgi:hypothetical protein